MPIDNFDTKKIIGYYIILGVNQEIREDVPKTIVKISKEIYFFNFVICDVKKSKVFEIETDREKNRLKQKMAKETKKNIIPVIAEEYKASVKNIKQCKYFIFYNKNINKNLKKLGIRMMFSSYFPVMFNNVL